MNCKRTRQLWELYRDSEGDAQLYLQVNEHLTGCPECTRWFDRQQSFEVDLAEKLREGTRNEELWAGIEAQLPATPRLISRRSTLILPLLGVAAAILVLVAAWQYMPAAEGNSELAERVSGCHERLVAGQEQLQFASRSDLEVEAYLKKRVAFPVRCPPRQDAGFEVRGGGVCSVGNSPVAYVHGLVGMNKVSVFILPLERLGEFSRDRDALQRAEIVHSRHGELETVLSAIDRNIVVVVGQESPKRLERVVRAYGTYPHTLPHDAT